MTEKQLNKLQRNFQQKEVLVDFVNKVAEFALTSSEYWDSDRCELMTLHLEDDGNVTTSDFSDNAVDIEKYLNTLFNEMKNKSNKS